MGSAISPFRALCRAMRWDHSANHDASLGKPIVLRSASERVSSTAPFTALSQRHSITSGASVVEAAHVATSAALKSASLAGSCLSTARGLSGLPVGAVAGTTATGSASDSCGVINNGCSGVIRSAPCLALSLASMIGSAMLQAIGAPGLTANELSQEFSFSE